MNLPKSIVFASLCVSLTLASPHSAHAGLVPAGDFQGKSLSDWGVDYSVWAFKFAFGVPPAPSDTIDGARALPPSFDGGDFVTNLTIGEGTPIVGAPLFLGGHRYDDGTSDLDIPDLDNVIHSIFEDISFTTTLDGVVVLEGKVTDFPDRLFGPSAVLDPVVYATPFPSGALELVVVAGITTIFDDLAVGQHTIVNAYEGFGTASYTYNITVVPVPEPASVVTIGSAAMLLAVWRGRKRKVLSAS